MDQQPMTAPPESTPLPVPAPPPPTPASVQPAPPSIQPAPTAASTIAPLKFTTFSPIGYLNAKHVSSAFVKQDSQSFQSRRKTEADWDSDQANKRRRLLGEDGAAEGDLKGEGEEEEEEEDGKLRMTGGSGNVLVKGVAKKARETKVAACAEANDDDSDDDTATVDPLTKTIVIQPGSRFLRIGLASEAYPIKVPNAIARRLHSPPTPSTTPPRPTAFLRPLPAPPAAGAGEDHDMLRREGSDDEGAGAAEPLDPLSMKIQSIRGDFKARMRAFKLRGQGNGNSTAKAYNESVQGEPLAAFNDDEGEIEWSPTSGREAKEAYVGDKALKVANPEKSGYSLRYPYDRGTFNEAGYSSSQELLGDIAQIWLDTLEEELGISQADLATYSAILLIPDLYEHVYVREMTDLVLHTIGFKQLWLQQEAVCTTFGAGVSSACVVDLGAKKTAIACVEEGLVLAETRMALDFGGDDITQFLHTLLLRNGFPYPQLDLGQWHGFKIVEELKEKIVVLGEKDVGMGLHEFWVRRPGETTKKYTMRVYDDAIMAPYALFAPRIIDFEGKAKEPGHLWSKEVEDIVEIGGYTEPTAAMHSSTSHLLPAQPAAPAPSLPSLPSLPPLPFPDSGAGSTEGTPAPPQHAAPAVAQPTAESSVAGSPRPAAPAGPAIDVRLESSKLPLDVAIVESILACGTEDRMRKVASNVILVGGTAAIHNIGFAVQSRVSPQLAYRVPGLNSQVEVVPPPREIEPDILAWKGIATLARLDVADDLWITRDDWDQHGLRALRERAFYFA